MGLFTPDDAPPTARNPFEHPFPLVLATLLLGHSVFRNKLTFLGGVTALTTAALHISFPDDTAWISLVTFFVAGTLGTRVGRQAKAGLTMSATGSTGGGEGPRNAVQVLANSGTADLLILAFLLGPGLLSRERARFGIACAYAAAAADTLSSELGILASGAPFMIVPPFRRVARGTNGGVTMWGLGAGLLGSGVLGLVHLYGGGGTREAAWVAVLGLGGSVLDSVLGAVLQATVEDKKSGRVVEGANGRRVLVKDGGSRVRRGLDVLNNNGVNFVMTLAIGLAGVAAYPALAKE